MDRDVLSLSPDASVEDVATVLADNDVEAVPIVDGNRVVGLVSEWELIQLLLVEDDDADTAAT
jgi:CBS domain-containing protein